jgi:vacuolar-type H+-ATPase subunit I/STV1
MIQSFGESITDKYGRKITTQGEADRFSAVVDYLREHEVLTVEDLDTKLTELKSSGLPIREQMDQVSSRIRRIEKLIEHGDRRAALDPIHDEYLKIHWKGRKEKFAKEHRDELDAWNKADRYMRKNVPEQRYDGDALRSELSSLHAELDALTEKIRPQQEEAAMLKEVRSYVRKLLPELEPDGEPLTPERRQEKIAAIRQRLAKAKEDAGRRAAAYEKTRQAMQRPERGR